MKRLFALPLLLAALTVNAQTSLPVDLEIGFRWLDLDGSEDVYRTQINEQDGFLIRSLHIATNEVAVSDLVDRFRVDVSDLGTGPAGAFRVETGKSQLWNLNLNYRQADAFNVHPGFALGQHRIDRERTSFDLDLELMPGRTITPFIGYSRGTYDGPGTTTVALGQDEFLLASDLDESEQEIRAGFGFHTAKFFGVVTQGWRSLESNETMTLFEGAGAGNNPGTVLGRPVNASGITRESNFDVSTPFTNAFVTAELVPRLRLIGDYSRFTAEGDGPELETATGSFVSFPLARFFNGFQDTVTSRAENTTWRGGLRAEFALTDVVDLFGGFRTEHRDLDGAAAFATIFRDTTNFGGVDPVAAIQELFETENAMQREEDQFEVGVAARQLGPFSVRASFARTNQDVTLSPDLAEIVVDGPEQGGQYDRSIDTINAMGAFAKNGFTASLSLRRDRADDPVMRTDFLDRDRIRLRAAYQFGKHLRIGAIAEQLEHENERTGTGYKSETQQYGTDVEVSFHDHFRVRGAYSRFDVDSSALIRRPESFLTETLTYAEDGDAVEGGFSILFAPLSLDADLSRFSNEGANPLDLDRYRVRVVWDFLARAGVAAEWARDVYDETLYPIANYEATRYGVYLRWRTN